MQTASLENCKRLYELSGWQDDFDYSYGKWHGGDSIVLEKNAPRPQGYSMVAPAYSAGYLLRQLPGIVELHRYENKQWSADTDGFGFENADTPEDALCLLAIKLFEEGVLH